MLVMVLMIGWIKIHSVKLKPITPHQQLITVLIPVRNEGNTLLSLLHDLSLQPNLYEVLIIDDHSDEHMTEEVEDFIHKDNRFRFLRSTNHGKKHALSQGIAEAIGSIIVTTDADCRVTPSWLQKISECFSDEHVVMAFGGVAIKQGSFFSTLQAIEFASLIGSGAATWQWGFPTMCNGANLAFRKRVFDEVGGYNDNVNIASGDDEFLMRKVFSKYPKGIQFIAEKLSVVQTEAHQNVAKFIHQRLRWASKWRHNTSVVTVGLALYIVCIQMITLFCILLIFQLDTTIGVVALLFLVSKAILEGWFLYDVGKFLNVRWNWLAFLLLQMMYAPYVLFIGVSSNFIPNRWKGRSI